MVVVIGFGSVGLTDVASTISRVSTSRLPSVVDLVVDDASIGKVVVDVVVVVVVVVGSSVVSVATITEGLAVVDLEYLTV